VLEIVVSLSLFAVLMSSLMLFLDTSRDAQREGIAMLELETRGRRAVDRIVESIRSAERTSITPAIAPPWSSSFVEYQVSLGDQGGAVAWGDPVRLWYDAAGGAVVHTENPGLPDERSTSWCSDVPALSPAETLDGLDDNGNGFVDESGLAFAVDGDVVTVLLTLVDDAGGGRTRTRAFQGTVRCRN
jgi:hypothetical protein